MVDKWELVGFAAGLLVPLGIGLYHGLRRPASYSAYAFVFGRKEIAPWLALPSAATLIGGPLALLLLLELPFARWTWLLFGLGLAGALVVFLPAVLPILHYVRSPSVYGYLDERFRSPTLKGLAAALYALTTLLYNVLVLGLVSQLAAAVVPTEPWVLALLLAVLAAFPALTGGLNGTLDLSLVYLPLGQIFLPAALLGVGLSRVRESLDFASLRPHWLPEEDGELSAALVIPFAFVSSLHFLAASQNLYQSFAPLVTSRQSLVSLVLALPLVVLLLTIIVGLSLLLEALTKDCVGQGLLLHPRDPFFNWAAVLTRLWDGVPGAAGLTTVGLVSLGLCVLSSNGLGQATVLWEDGLSCWLGGTKERRQVLAIQLLLCGYVVAVGGSAALGLGLVEDLWAYAGPALLTANSLLAPLTAVFVAGIFIPCSNAKGAMAGLVGGLLASSALSSGYLYLQQGPGGRPFRRELGLPPACLTNASLATFLASSPALPPLSPSSEPPPTEEPTPIPVFTYTTTIPSLFQPAPSMDSSTAGPPLPPTFPPLARDEAPSTEASAPTLPPALFDALDEGPAEGEGNATSYLETLTELLSEEELATTSSPPPSPSTTLAANSSESVNATEAPSTEPASNETLVLLGSEEAANGTEGFFSSVTALRLSSEQRAAWSNSSESGALAFLRAVCSLSPLLHPVMVFGLSLLLVLLVSLLTGGNDIYSMDWNLVFWTCHGCTRTPLCCSGGEEAGSMGKRRGRRGLKSAYVASDSFRYARQAPPYLEPSNYRNPRVAQMEPHAHPSSTTSTSCPQDSRDQDPQTSLQEDFFSTLRPVH